MFTLPSPFSVTRFTCFSSLLFRSMDSLTIGSITVGTVSFALFTPRRMMSRTFPSMVRTSSFVQISRTCLALISSLVSIYSVPFLSAGASGFLVLFCKPFFALSFSSFISASVSAMSFSFSVIACAFASSSARIAASSVSISAHSASNASRSSCGVSAVISSSIAVARSSRSFHVSRFPSISAFAAWSASPAARRSLSFFAKSSILNAIFPPSLLLSLSTDQTAVFRISPVLSPAPTGTCPHTRGTYRRIPRTALRR